MNGGYAHVRQRGHDTGYRDDTRGAGGRNEVGGHVYYKERFKQRGQILYVALIFQLVESLSYTPDVCLGRRKSADRDRLGAPAPL